MFEQQLAKTIRDNKSDYELFEIWDGGRTTYGFMDDEGLHHFSTEDERNACLAARNPS